MEEAKNAGKEESLDPEDWQGMRMLGHRMVDDMMNYLETIRERPVWQPVPQAVRAHLKAPLPAEPQGAESAYQDFLQNVLPHPLGNIHPRFWGWVCGTGTPFGMLVEMLKAGMNSTIFGCDQAPLHVETQVLDWCKAMLGYPAGASGLLVTGATMANLIGLTVARNAGASFNVARQGLQAASRKMTLYGIEKYRRLIEQNVEQARFLVSLIEAAPELELLAPAPLNIVCFRFIHENLRNEQLNALNQELLIQLHESGIAVPSSTMLNGKFALRVAITNHRSRQEDFEILVCHVINLGKKLIIALGF